MKKLGIALLIVLLVAMGVVPAAAQDGDSENVQCDASTILLLLVAEGDYGFHSELDLSVYDRGEFSDMFGFMMDNMMGDDMAEDDMAEDDMAEDDMAEDDMSDESMDEDMGDDEMMDDMTTLSRVIDGEPEACTSLRAELVQFFIDEYNMMMDDDM